MADAVDPVQQYLEQHTKSSPGFKFKDVGDSILGTVTRRDIAEVPDLNNPGQKVRKLVLELKTDREYTQSGYDKDNKPVMVTGQDWSLWIGPSQLLGALSTALKEAGAPPGSPQVGDRLGVEVTGFEEPKQRGHNAKRLHRVSFKAGNGPLASAAPSQAGISVDDL